MSDRYTLSPGVAVVSQTATSWFVLRETGRRLIREGIAAEVVRLIRADSGDEDQLVDALAARFPAEQVYFALIQLRKSGVISVAGQADTPDSLFYEALTGLRDNSGLGRSAPHPLPLPGVPERGSESSTVPGAGSRTAGSGAVLPVRIVSLGELDSAWLAESLARSTRLQVQALADWHEADLTPDAIYVVTTPDYLEPELEAFGQAARGAGVRWLPIKAEGVIPRSEGVV